MWQQSLHNISYNLLEEENFGLYPFFARKYRVAFYLVKEQGEFVYFFIYINVLY
jgi:hypothetical protein